MKNLSSVEKIKKRISELEEKLKEEYEKEKKREKERKYDTRAKILIGAYVKSNPKLFSEITSSSEFEKYLTRNTDRTIFGLPPKTQEEKKKKETKEETPNQNIVL